MEQIYTDMTQVDTLQEKKTRNVGQWRESLVMESKFKTCFSLADLFQTIDVTETTLNNCETKSDASLFEDVHVDKMMH